ncbi:MAG: hypothetical protein JW892_14735 [Anaerolineae bacterium]|nr:hypothetical protein [Anaerolineae bacterium]
MNEPSPFEDRLDARIAASRERQRQAQEDLAARFRRVEQEQEAQIRVWRTLPLGPSSRFGEASAGSERLQSPVQAQVALSTDALLQQLDTLMWEAFGLNDHFPGAPLGQYPVIYCETLQEFFTPFVLDEDASESSKQEALAALIAEAEEQARTKGGGILGINVPGRGCFVNGWFFGFARGVAPRAALQDPEVLPRIVETVCHEKLGHGYIAALTAAGQEKTRLGLWRFDLAQHFHLRTVDTPQSALLLRKYALVHATTRFSEEGWATWIEQTMLWLAARKGLLPGIQAGEHLQAKYSLAAVGQLLQQLRENAAPESDERMFFEVVAAVTQILADDKTDFAVGDVFTAIRAWQEVSAFLDDAFSQVFGQPAVYVLGYLLLRKLEARLGWQNLPYAVAIAGNVSYDLETIAVTDLEQLLNHNPRLNVDARLALLSTLRLQPGEGPAELARLAREKLDFALPEGWG